MSIVLPCRALSTRITPLVLDAKGVTLKKALEQRVNVAFSEPEKRLYEQFRNQLNQMHRNAQITFRDKHITLSQEILDRIAFYFVFHGLEKMPDFELHWEYIPYIDSPYEGLILKFKDFKYHGYINVAGIKDDNYLDEVISSECVHVAQCVLRDSLDLDAPEKKLYCESFRNTFIEAGEWLNTAFIRFVRNKSQDVKNCFRERGKYCSNFIEFYFGTVDPHSQGSFIARDIGNKFYQWGNDFYKDPSRFFKAYSRLLALADFSAVGSFTNNLDDIARQLSIDDPLTRQEGLCDFNRLVNESSGELQKRGYNISEIKRIRQQVSDGSLDRGRSLLPILLNSCLSVQQRMLIVLREHQHYTKIKRKLQSIRTPTELFSTHRLL